MLDGMEIGHGKMLDGMEIGHGIEIGHGKMLDGMEIWTLCDKETECQCQQSKPIV